MAFTIPNKSISFHQKFEKFINSRTLYSRPLSVSPLIRSTVGLEKMLATIYTISNQKVEKTKKRLVVADELDDNDGFLKFLSSWECRIDMLVLGGRYKFIKLIGQGTFAQIVEAEDLYSVSPKQRVAIKILRSGMTDLGLQECSLHLALSREEGFESCSIVRPISSFHHKNHFCLVMELLPASLMDLMQSSQPFLLSPSKIRKLAWQMCTALYFLRTKGIIHADIRPENILIQSVSKGLMKSKWKIKLADFGNSFLTHFRKVYYDDFNVQTLTYRAPEILFGLPFDSQIGSQILFFIFHCTQFEDFFQTCGPLDAFFLSFAPEVLCSAAAPHHL